MENKKFFECWKYIEKKAFSPGNKDRDIEGWLNCFVTFFYKIYEQGANFPNIRDKEKNKFCKELMFSSIGAKLDFIIYPEISKFSFHLKWKRNDIENLNLHFEYDSKYKCEWDYINEPKRYRMNPDFNKSELEDILEDMIKHPAVHCHVFSELWNKKEPDESENERKLDDFLHEIRISVPTKNPFLFLYQVSFQFLSIFGEQKKEKEFERLTGVIWKNKNNISISPGLLFGLKDKK